MLRTRSRLTIVCRSVKGIFGVVGATGVRHAGPEVRGFAVFGEVRGAMRRLLDSHVFLWYITADSRLPSAFRAAAQDPDNEVYLSAASIWEAVIVGGISRDLDGCKTCPVP